MRVTASASWPAIALLLAASAPLLAQDQDKAPQEAAPAVKTIPDAVKTTPGLAPLPEPFTLEDAISMSLTDHPAVRRARAEQTMAEAERLQAESTTGFTASAKASAIYIQPNAVASDQSNDDSSLTLSLRKRLYDFGRSEHALKAADAEIQARQIDVHHAQSEQLLEVMRRYFDAVEADLAFNVANEGMSIAFIRWDRLKERQALGQVSDIDVEEANTEFNRWRVRVRKTENQQRSTRALLANAFNRPNDLPSTLEPPEMAGNLRVLEEFDTLLKQAMQASPELLALRGRVEAAGHRLQSAEATGNPSLNAQFDTGVWNRDLGGRNEWSAGLVLEVPLFTGGLTDANSSRRRAEMDKLQADLDAASMRIRQQILEAWLGVDTARAEVQETNIGLDFRDLYLDRSRALYELEAKSDLGDAMTRWSEAKLAHAKAEHNLAMAFARLDALTDKPIIDRMQGIGIRQPPPAPTLEPNE